MGFDLFNINVLKYRDFMCKSVSGVVLPSSGHGRYSRCNAAVLSVRLDHLLELITTIVIIVTHGPSSEHDGDG